jgi:hypothetical protein
VRRGSSCETEEVAVPQYADAALSPGEPGPCATADPELAEVYRDLHANPELAFQETRTAGSGQRSIATGEQDQVRPDGRTPLPRDG